jgi:hypothetical protein
MIPTRAEYEQAKQHQLDNPNLYATREPTPEVLANVATINAYEGGQPNDGTCPCVWYAESAVADHCTCTHTQPDHVDGLCTGLAP